MGDESGSTGRSYARVPVDVERLRELRRARGWSQHELSVRVGVQGATVVSAWETGVSVPHPRTLLRVAEAFEVDPISLLSRQADELSFDQLRAARGLSRRALAVAASVSLTTIRRWEAGDFKTLPSAQMVRAVASALSVPVDTVAEALEASRRSADD